MPLTLHRIHWAFTVGMIVTLVFAPAAVWAKSANAYVVGPVAPVTKRVVQRPRMVAAVIDRPVDRTPRRAGEVIAVELRPYVTNGPVAVFNPAVPRVEIRQGRSVLAIDPRGGGQAIDFGGAYTQSTDTSQLPESSTIVLAQRAWQRYQSGLGETAYVIRAAPRADADLPERHEARPIRFPAAPRRFVPPRPVVRDETIALRSP